MKELIDFIKSKDIEETNFFTQLKCTKEEAVLLQFITKEYAKGRDSLVVIDILSNFSIS